MELGMHTILVDDEDRWLLEEYTWYISDSGYAMTRAGGILTRLHHCIRGQPMWEGEEFDHINRNRLDDRRRNIRWVTRKQNTLNKQVSTMTGIYPHTNGGYQVRVKRDGIQHYLGIFGTLDEAVAERDEWLHSHRGPSMLDEVEFRKEYNECCNLVDKIEDTNVRNAMNKMLQFIVYLNEKMAELYQEDDDE